MQIQLTINEKTFLSEKVDENKKLMAATIFENITAMNKFTLNLENGDILILGEEMLKKAIIIIK